MKIEAGIIKAVCLSEKRGTAKINCGKALLRADWGIEGDAHAGNWHRQVSLLSYDKIQDFIMQGANVNFGDFGENIVAESIDFRSLPVGTRLVCGQAEMEITQIGKTCHSHCAIYRQIGDCIMPREGVFARVLRSGAVSVGDAILICG
jgi:MOSC domain-containing protein YiiM